MVIYDTMNYSPDGKRCDIVVTSPDAIGYLETIMKQCDVESALRYVKRSNAMNGIVIDSGGHWHIDNTSDQAWTPGY